MQYIKEVLENKCNVVVWGCGQLLHRYAKVLKEHCNVVALSDSNVQLYGKRYEGWNCISPEQIVEKSKIVVIAVANPEYRRDIQKKLISLGVKYCSLDELLHEIFIKKEQFLLKNKYLYEIVDQPPHKEGIMKKYIGITVPANECNLKCSYCYLSQVPKSRFGLPKISHMPKYIRYQLSNKKVGGEALIGLSGAGETLLCDKFTEICIELLKEGHYLHIVTNGLLIDKIKEIVETAGDYASHIIFKLSFHYEQLLSRGLLENFSNTVEYIRNSPASFTIELMPHDELIPYIEEVKKFSLEKFGALPQLTIGRDDSKAQNLLTKMNFEDYRKTWEVFGSGLFELKMNYYMCQTKNCMAGKYSMHIDLINGNVSKCLGDNKIANLYDEDFDAVFEPVGNDCKLSYCYNCHVYLTTGNMPHISAPTYLEVRDRVTTSGEHWIKEPMRKFIGQKLFENN